MRSNGLTPHIYDVYLAAEKKIRRNAPQLLDPLKDALILALDDHVQIAPPAGETAITVTAAFVWSQDPQSNQQHRVTHDRRARRAYFCSCPAFKTNQHTHNGRTFCKHMIAAQLYIRAAKAKSDHDPHSINAHMIAVINAHLQPVLA